MAYPPHYGTFIGFKPSHDGDLYFCSCAREAIENYVQCEIEGLTGSHQDPTPENVLNGGFPEETKDIVRRAGINDASEIPEVLRFEDQLCHECNAVVPKRRYCADMYGTVFRQNYGWYVYKKSYEYGVCKPKSDTLLADTLFDSLPGEIVSVVDDDLIEELEAKAARFNELRQKRFDREREIENAKKDEMRELRDEFGDERGSDEYYDALGSIREKYEGKDPLAEDEQAELDELREELSENSKRVSDTIENEVRQAVGHYEKGNRWTSETILYQLIESRYGDEYTIERHHRPDWLDGLELDIFLVEPGVGIEYQGVQHYEAVEHWGGEEALEERQARDERTRELCAERGVELVEVRHDEELSEELVTSKVDAVIDD
ncbi:PDDEXK family nuclease [Halostella salina]|uniref:hypothetical protein n=1 Tax=Halostella salina TaxID=1547897 RepID=UPI0013CEE221|nr:hypothetical protein [Halostella salina]